VQLPNSERVILQLLVGKGSCYGLELVESSRGALKRGGVYVTLGRMEEKGLVKSSVGESGRRLYKPTALGERALAAAQVFTGRIKLAKLGAKA
jgi:PadR family transcriptional regulator, regulatory protein PadR